MSKRIQLRNVPDELHRRLKARAAAEGLSLSEYLIRGVQRVAERPTIAEPRQQLAQRARVVPCPSPARAIRAERERQ